jgi:dTDP-4-dehydrorhamnose 3,5-epimerase-like enzyme
MARTKKNRRVETRSKDGQPNGFLVPIFNVHEGFVATAQHPQQVYLTVVAPRAVKGPHLHHKRWGLFTCVKGNVRIVMRTEAGYEEHYSGEGHDFATIQVPAGVPSALVNLGDDEAYVLNMPSPAWSAEEPDDHPVSFADHDLP